ncbi:MAG: NUDIX domain-containing protein [Haloferacaceae archaeon]
MDHVVTAFLRNRGKILLVRRAPSAEPHPDRWAGISDYLEAEPADALVAIERVLREAVGVERTDLVRSGAPLTTPGNDRSRLVHPFLFDVGERQLRPNGEIAAAEWLPPTAMRGRRTVPLLWEAYRRVSPSVETIETDDVHGASWLSLRALEVLRDRAATADGWEEVAAIAERLRDARPGMVAIGNRVNHVMAAVVGGGGDGGGGSGGRDAAKSPTPARVHDRAVAAIERAADADDAAARLTAERIASGRHRSGDGPVVTLSRSGTVLATLRELDSRSGGDGTLSVLVGESRPDREGVGTAEALAERGIAATLAADGALPWLLERRDACCLLAGADAVDPGGGVYNKAGTYGVALAARRAGIPVVVVAARAKVAPSAGFRQERSDPAAVYGGSAGVQVATPRFDRTPPDLVTAIVTEEGPQSTKDVREIASEHREAARWAGDDG